MFRVLHKICDDFYIIAQQKCPWTFCDAPGVHLILDADPPGYYCTQHTDMCDYCKHMTTSSVDNKFYAGADMVSICPKCQPGVTCPNCMEVVHKQNLPIKNEQNQTVGCQKCRQKCDSCDKYFDKEDMIHAPDEDILCQECFDETYTSCIECGDIIEIDGALDTKNGPGCKDCFAECRYCNTAEDRGYMTEVDGNHYCEVCFGEYFIPCSSCSEPVERDEANVYEDPEGDYTEYCNSCWESDFITCDSCGKPAPKEDATAHPDWGEIYCEACEEERALEVPYEYQKYTKRVKMFNFGSASRYLQMIRRLAPISVKDLKKNYPNLFTAAKDLVSFAKGKTITPEIIDEFEGENSASFGLEYSGWNSELQRSVGDTRDVGQLVLNIIAPPPLVDYLRQDRAYELFDRINETSKGSGHPYKKDQMGWARLELNERENYILVDEIQTDHLNALQRIYSEKYEDATYAQHIRSKWNLSEEEFAAIADKLKKVVKPFPNIAVKAISDFARANGFDKLYWHTYESGMDLKDNKPPKSLYTQVPKKNFFKPTDDKPFNLDGQFFARIARRAFLRKIIKAMS